MKAPNSTEVLPGMAAMVDRVTFRYPDNRVAPSESTGGAVASPNLRLFRKTKT